MILGRYFVFVTLVFIQHLWPNFPQREVYRITIVAVGGLLKCITYTLLLKVVIIKYNSPLWCTSPGRRTQMHKSNGRYTNVKYELKYIVVVKK